MTYEQITFRELTSGITDYEIDKAIARGSGFENGRIRIRNFFSAHPDKNERIEMLKDEYGIGGWSHAINGYNRSHLHHDGKGIILTKDDNELHLTWGRVESIIDRLIKEGSY